MVGSFVLKSSRAAGSADGRRMPPGTSRPVSLRSRMTLPGVPLPAGSAGGQRTPWRTGRQSGTPGCSTASDRGCAARAPTQPDHPRGQVVSLISHPKAQENVRHSQRTERRKNGAGRQSGGRAPTPYVDTGTHPVTLNTPVPAGPRPLKAERADRKRRRGPGEDAVTDRVAASRSAIGSLPQAWRIPSLMNVVTWRPRARKWRES
jgi:hypothetical protein